MLKKLLLLSLTTHLLHSEEPIFGGTLLSPIPVNMAPHEWFIEPYLNFIHEAGTYTSHWGRTSSPHFTSTLLQLQFETGITPWLDIALYTNFFHTPTSFHLGDTQLALGFQLIHDTIDLRLILQESFPSGKYDNLKSHSQSTGSGAYETWITAVLYKELLPFTLNLSFNYVIPSNVTVHGLSTYAPPTHTTFRPGQQSITNLGIEYSITRHIIFALDLHHQHQNSSRLTPSLEQFSLAPCLEYNPTPVLGFEAGAYFTVTGRNSPIFTTASLTAYWQF